MNRTTRRLIKATQHDSWRTLSAAALAELVELGLWDGELWTITAAGQARLDAQLVSASSL